MVYRLAYDVEYIAAIYVCEIGDHSSKWIESKSERKDIMSA